MFWWKRRKKAPELTPLGGTVVHAGRTWVVGSEKRGGKQTQLVILTAEDDPQSRMHYRPPPDLPIVAMEQLQIVIDDPESRSFRDAAGDLWEARIVVRGEPGKSLDHLIKFIRRLQVFELDYPYDTGLGSRSDQELRDLLASEMDGRA